MKQAVRFLSIASLVCLIVTVTSTAGLGTASGGSAPQPVQGEIQDGSAFVDNMLTAVRQWHDYSSENELDVHLAPKAKVCRCKFFYKGGQIRVEAVGGGYRDGSILVRQKDGQIRAKGGLMLGYMKMYLDPDSRMLILPNSINVMKSDLPTLMSDLKQALQQGARCTVTTTPIQQSGMAKSVYVVDVVDPGSSSTAPSRRIYVDSQLKVPVRWDLYKDGKCFSTAWFRNLHPNTGLADDLFQL